jgi:phosphatidate cytidylyltransferase
LKNRILVSLVGVPILLLVLLGLPSIYTPVLISLLSMVASFELSRALGVKQLSMQAYSILLAGAVPFWVYYGELPLPALCGLFLYVALLFMGALPSHYTVKVELIGGVFFFSVFVPYFLSSIVRIGLNPLRHVYILVPLVIPFLSDAIAMFSGMLFGRRKLAPEISPKKTMEGSLGGLLGGTLAVLLYGFIISQVTTVQVHYESLVIYGLLGSAVSQIGDLSFSYVKRQNSIKDFGSIFPGHGGVLDRFDSVIFCAPLVEILIILLPAFTS